MKNENENKDERTKLLKKIKTDFKEITGILFPNKENFVSEMIKNYKKELNSPKAFNYIEEYGNGQILNSDCLDCMDIGDDNIEFNAGYHQGYLHCLQKIEEYVNKNNIAEPLYYCPFCHTEIILKDTEDSRLIFKCSGCRHERISDSIIEFHEWSKRVIHNFKTRTLY